MMEGLSAYMTLQASEHDEAAQQLARYRERAGQAPVLFSHPERIVAMYESRLARSESLLRSVLEGLPDGELPRAMAHEHALVRRLAVGEKARRLKEHGRR